MSRHPAGNHTENKMKKRICIIDGHGGGIGSTMIRYIKQRHKDRFELVAVGTNAIATAAMLKAGARKGVSGENALIYTVARVDIIIGPVSITWPNAILGENTPDMAEAVVSSPAVKILLPLHQENIHLIDFDNQPLPHIAMFIADEKIKEVLENV